MKLLCIKQSRDRLPEKWLQRWLRAIPGMLNQPKLAKKELVLVFVSSSEMKRLNNQYRQKNYATDVLSFEAAEETCVGELVICLPVVRSQSKRTGLSERGELGYMITHGVLHLLGHDHDDPKREAKMFALQDKLYGQLEKKIGLR